MHENLLEKICLCLACMTAILLAWRDIRTRQLLDRELAWFTLFTSLFRLLTNRVPLRGAWPLWTLQTWDLIRTTAGGVLLLALAAPARLLAGRTLLGIGDILFALAAGFLLPVGASIPMVVLAFFLAFPFSLFEALVRKGSKPLPFIPFLAASTLLLYWLPLGARCF